MKFLRITFRCFGPFEECPLDLAGGSNMHVVYGPNEAGKSSALRGLYALLFGFPTQSTDNFRFNYPQFRVLAALQNAAGDTLDCIRRKGNKATLRQGDDKTEIPDSLLAEFLGGLQQSQFEQLFGLDCERLVAGGKEMAAGQGDLGEALFAAGAGLAGLRKLEESLADRRKALFTPSGRLQPIGKSLAELAEQLATVRSESLLPDKYAEAVTANESAATKSKELRDERNKVRARLAQLQLYQTALPTIDLLQQAEDRFQPVAQAPLLPADFERQFNTAWKESELARTKLADLKEQHAQLATLQQTAEPPADVLAEEAEIDAVGLLIGADRKSQQTAIEADTRRREFEAEARDIFKELTGSTDWAQMPSLKPRRDDEDRIQELAAEYKAVQQAVAAAEDRLLTMREALRSAETRYAQLGPARTAPPWLALVEELTSHGPLEELARKRQVTQTTQEKKLQAEFAKLLPGGTCEWSDAATLPVPQAAAIADYRQRLKQETQGVADQRKELQQSEQELAAGRLEIAAETGAEAPPSIENLTAARGERDSGLQLIRQRLTSTPDVAGEQSFIASRAPGQSLIDVTEATVRKSDQVADRLRREADRVAATQAAQQRLQAWQIRREEVARHLTNAELRLNQTEQAWRQLWQPAGIVPQSPEAMQDWLTRWERYLADVVSWAENQGQLTDELRQITAFLARLVESCPAAASAQTLAEGLTLARQLAKEVAEKTAQAEKLQADVQRLNTDVSTAESAFRAAQQAQATWQQQWVEAIGVLRLQKPETSIATAQKYLKQIGEMQQKLSDARIKAAVVRDLEAERAHLLQRLTSLRQRLEPGAKLSTGESLNDDFRSVELALKAARVTRTQFDERAKQLHKLAKEIDVTKESLRLAEASLAALAQQAAVRQVSEIPAAVQQAKQRAATAAELKGYERAIAEIARDQISAEFSAAALRERETVGSELLTLDSRVKELDGEISAAEGEALTTKQALDVFLRASDVAAAARQQAELVMGRLSAQVTEYAALHVASVALDRAKERYRERNQDTLLARAGEFFRTLTGQAFSGLDIDNEEGTDVLKAVRDNGHPNSRVAVTGLSDGSRDQLFLALRLAGIEQHLQQREPVPLIIDDVLMTFDDARARATLKCLAELSAKTQVLLFTHHEHVVRLAQEVCPAAVQHKL